MRFIINFLLSILLVPLIISFIYEACLFLISDTSFYLENLFAYGFLVYILIYILILRQRIAFVEHFEHELGHAIVALFFLRDVREFLVNPEKGSEVKYQGSSNTLISLAPYYLPVFTIPLVVIQPFVFSPVQIIIDFLIGFTLAFHYISLLKEFRWDQPDIEKTGRIFSLCMACILNTIFLVFILCIVSGNYLDILNYFKNSVTRTPESYGIVLQALMILNDFKDQLLQQWLTHSVSY